MALSSQGDFRAKTVPMHKESLQFASQNLYGARQPLMFKHHNRNLDTRETLMQPFPECNCDSTLRINIRFVPRFDTVAAASNQADTFHAAAEWETWRPLITQLYFIEDKTLQMVQKILADDYGLYATERMFSDESRNGS
ncbi:hypothetical protein GJ744_011709 [Endocarpon pusillum]|uniref:Clr5 domain-containing protein n=1 Tax=Endocarpon pusillum TaxID=364733 RepID=A0A8H7AE89_9EURO|nr:hypothetical protein GJ744_011709 [Endocarpon pusillum]